ncbi:MAG: polysaccharide biosynthesis C-terminal domain-containing protein [Lachnospiraceae bacterium]|nr:polysaccharide biosynthesis C-terminal domain-containing protein [Lachnospiraceae bacterium]
MKQTRDIRMFFQYVIPSVLSFALSGVYTIVDGFFIGNRIGDLGLSAVNIAYPIVAAIQALGTGIGMGGAIYYSIYKAEKKEEQAREFIAGALWVLIISSVLLTIAVFLLNSRLLRLLGADGELLALGEEYIAVIALGAFMQVVGTGLVPFIRNHGGSFYAMVSMIAGFVTNIILDYLFVWILEQGVSGAAWATVIGQGVTMLIALAYLLHKKQFTLSIPFSKFGKVSASILKIGIAPFGLTMSPNISLIIINRFSMFYGGEPAVATYACIAYVICIVYLILQGVGDGSQPLLSQYYGEKNSDKLKSTRNLAYGFALFLSVIGCIIMYLTRGSLGILFGASTEVNTEIAKIMPVFLLSVPFVAILRITTASFYATEKSMFSYVLTFIEPLFMLVLMLILPPLFGGQIMIWWSTVLARILSASLAVILKKHVDKKEMP